MTRDCDSDAPAGSTGTGCCWRQDEGVHTDNGNPSQPKSRAPLEHFRAGAENTARASHVPSHMRHMTSVSPSVYGAAIDDIGQSQQPSDRITDQPRVRVESRHTHEHQKVDQTYMGKILNMRHMPREKLRAWCRGDAGSRLPDLMGRNVNNLRGFDACVAASPERRVPGAGPAGHGQARTSVLGSIRRPDKIGR